MDGIRSRRAPGTVTGAAWVGWDGNYSFNADGRRIPVESLAAVDVPAGAALGLLQFDATGTGTFEAPRYDVKFASPTCSPPTKASAR